MKAKIFSFIVLGIMVLMSLFAYIPFSQVDLTDQGRQKLGSFEVDQEWQSEGTLYNLNTDGDIIYPDATSTGNWTSFMVEGEQMDVINIAGVSDLRDGTVNASLLLYEDPGSSPDSVRQLSFNSPNFEHNFTGINDSYDFFEVALVLNETSGSSNERPSVDSVSVEYVENLSRTGLGFGEESFQVLTLLVFIGSGIFALLRTV